jgi:hypothetical protein
MIKGEFADDEICGCGSGEHYVKCCKGSWGRYVRDERGNVSKTILLSEEAVSVLKEAREHFKEIFGRYPRGRDRVMTLGFRYDDRDYQRQVREVSKEAGIPKAIVYATGKTGLWVSEENYEHLAPMDRRDWDEAIEEYFSAEEDGIDLLDPPPTPINMALLKIRKVMDHFVVHIGSYLDRSPRRTRKDWSLFSQYLLISKIFWHVKLISDRWETITTVEISALARGIYEASILIFMVNHDREFADILKAQTFSGTEIYLYRTKKDGSSDFGKVIDPKIGEVFNIRISYRECASKIGESHLNFFDVIYPMLSNQIHFNSLDMVFKFHKNGTFLLFDDSDERTTAILACICGLYLASGLLFVDGIQKQVKKDIEFIGSRLAEGLDELIDAFIVENVQNENLALAVDAFAEVSWT